MLRRFYNFHLSKHKVLARELRALLGFVPKRLHYYRTAFSHRSLLSARQGADFQSNERLEFLGDAILGAVTAEYLFSKYPNRDEGFLTDMRSKIVNRKSMNCLAESLELDIFLRHLGVVSVSGSMMGNSLEALIGAVYLDVGYNRTKIFVIQKILKMLINLEELDLISRTRSEMHLSGLILIRI